MHSRPVSPPPPCPSPELQPSPLPSPPVLKARLLAKQLSTTHERINEKAKATLWLDGDEFGSDKPVQPAAPSPVRKRVARRQSSLHIRTCSPPPSPTLCSPPPPVPPIPAFALSSTDKKSELPTPPPLPTWPAKIIPEYSLEGAERAMMRRKRGASAVTCSQFMVMHNGGIPV